MRRGAVMVLVAVMLGSGACRDMTWTKLKRQREIQRNPGESSQAAAAGSGYGVGLAREAITLGKLDRSRPGTGAGPVDRPTPQLISRLRQPGEAPTPRPVIPATPDAGAR